ncbi:flagellar hook-length control protein FliK [Brevundimonas sp.]|jgi:hypothetical protein|uniref:flagellar hook-length control protein FliK n=1 Tax=Brevundimonas sp. TaxID=1871086 RepID=UPI002E109B49|nr:flagellar hook-length control protein FliK [Brevundimonas sp.]
MLAQSLFALAVPAAPQAGDAPAAPADGEFGRLVDVATRPAEAQVEAQTAARLDKPSAAPVDWTGPQILPGAETTPKARGDAPPRPEVLPGEPRPKLDADAPPVPEVLPGPPTVPVEPRIKGSSLEEDPSPEILPTSVGPDDAPRPEILPVTVGPDFKAFEKGGGAQTSSPDAAPAQSPAPLPALPQPDTAGRPAAAGADVDVTPSASSEATATGTKPTSESPPAPTPADAASSAPKAPTLQPQEPARFEPPVQTASSLEPAPTPSSEPAATTVQTSMVGLSRVAHETLADLTAQIVRRLEGKVTRFEMALTPEDLGRVDVSLEMGEDGSLTARLAFDTPAAAAEMRAQVDQLRRQLEQAGFQLARDALDFSHRDGSSPQQDRFERRQNRAFAAARDLADRVEAAPLMNLSLSLGSARDRVDVKV